MAIKTILVEDSQKIRENLIPTLGELANVEIIAVAETQVEAKNAFDAFKGTWQLVIVDMFLREGTGLGVLRSCQDRTSDQTAFVLTNYPTTEIRRQCAALGADGVFDKSIELDTFIERCLAI